MFFIVFISMQSIAVTLPALPIELNQVLGFSDWVVGITMGIQAIVTVALRHRAGSYCDTRGSKEAVCLGLWISVVSSLVYLLAAAPMWTREVMLAWIIVSRVLLGIGEALFITGVMSWGISRLGVRKTGKVMTWQGIALYSSMGLGASLGLFLQKQYGFVSVAIVSLVAPLIALVIATSTQRVAALGGHRASFLEVINLIWKPGMVLTLASVPFATMSAFLSLVLREPRLDRRYGHVDSRPCDGGVRNGVCSGSTPLCSLAGQVRRCRGCGRIISDRGCRAGHAVVEPESACGVHWCNADWNRLLPDLPFDGGRSNTTYSQ